MPLLNFVGISNPSSTQKATGGGNTSNSLPTPPSGAEAPTSGGYSNLVSSDDGRWGTTSSSNWAYQIYRWVLPAWIAPSSVLSIFVYYEGRIGANNSGQFDGGNGSVYVYNFITPAWDLFGSGFWDFKGPDQTFTKLYINPKNYINSSGYIYVGALSDVQGDGSGSPSVVQTDYPYLILETKAGFFINLIPA